uniref:Uncharacterized protein n=1 Tax=Oryza sativa subsp. japonica TaxID=39947 RepID=Q6H478_ORYSJ|nr:hypothetical protein [Oryza sativa Japonica Group]BAD26471.1 hypothetical protein [Oryza sativa Japonica Group]
MKNGSLETSIQIGHQWFYSTSSSSEKTTSLKPAEANCRKNPVSKRQELEQDKVHNTKDVMGLRVTDSLGDGPLAIVSFGRNHSEDADDDTKRLF